MSVAPTGAWIKETRIFLLHEKLRRTSGAWIETTLLKPAVDLYGRTPGVRGLKFPKRQ